ncbi:Bacterial extracellular solute-binding protein, family 3 [Pseudodesulfovibrio hydrargyri]|uniref:Bacterial extracellular solute-binding protein, family 3 n=1 Tax=Pseudodesulfovibrio hydrargyri TaxID=2125990 RepID=A0A1J5N8C0_9BACT|nr:transporter substrate-binding domain-containing protein [Pseudodesulfovibrio hydrargyri]OIQ51875.1 Bacterial extracellular solute-binding protein, family 3 [Pseudodesulfovibrio hydrargyri]
MKRILTTAIFLILGLGAAPRAGAGDFIAMGAPYPPYCVSDGLTVKGMAVSTLTTIMNMCDTPISDREIRLTPWAYGYESAARQTQRILLNAQRNIRTEHLYKWVGPVATAKIVLIGRKRDKLFIPTREQLKDYSIATVRWSRPEKTLLAGGMEEERLLRSPSHVQALRRLDSGEADLFASTELGAACQLAGMGLRPDDFAVYFTFDEEPLYFAFSRDTDDRLIRRLNKALQEIKATGPQGLSRFDKMFAD